MERLFTAGWMSIGFASRFSKRNHAWPLDVLGQPLLITRNNRGELHVFYNVCRHRGHVLVAEAESAGKLLRCPYHSWCYSLNGDFISAPYWNGSEASHPDADQKSAMNLVTVEYVIWYDVIFVNLSGDAQPFGDFIYPLDQRWSQRRPESDLRCFSHKNFAMEGNWKLVAENFLDNYHLPWVHPEIGSSVEASLGLEVENLHLSNDIVGFSHPTAGADKSKTAKPLPVWRDVDAIEAGRQDLFFLFPNTCFVMEGSYLWSMTLQPSSVDQCEEQLALYVVGEKATAEQYSESRCQLSNLIYNINAQDAKVIQGLQKGRQCDAASAGVYTPFHDELAKAFHQTVFDKLLSAKTQRGPI